MCSNSARESLRAESMYHLDDIHVPPAQVVRTSRCVAKHYQRVVTFLCVATDCSPHNYSYAPALESLDINISAISACTSYYLAPHILLSAVKPGSSTEPSLSFRSEQGFLLYCRQLLPTTTSRQRSCSRIDFLVRSARSNHRSRHSCSHDVSRKCAG